MVLASLLVQLSVGYGDAESLADREKKFGFSKTIFVFEMVRHGSRAHFEDNVDAMEFFGVPKGQLTELGR